MGSCRMLPVIDLSKENLKPGSSSWLSACNDVRRALEEYSCFVAVYDKVPSELRNKMFGELKELFDLPTEIKKQNNYGRRPGSYTGPASIFLLQEAMGISNATDVEEIRKFTNLMWPTGNDRFSETVYSYGKQLVEVDRMVTRMIFEGYGAGKHHNSFVDSNHYVYRFTHYNEPGNNGKNYGLPSHTDKNFITIIHQNHINGLEMKTKDGEWIDFDATPSSFLVLAGDALQVWSNGRIIPSAHRVNVSGYEARYSVVLFNFHSGTMEVPEELVDVEHPLQFKPFDNFGYYDYAIHGGGSNTETCVEAYCGV